tara:strand:+ start:8087 stop:10348 length:2262 start_codon:yes stop_codon:yes gene_type:complete
MQKNVASQKMIVFAFNKTNNNPLTGDAANITANISKDYAASVSTNDVNPTETEDGYYAFDLTQAETNADVIQVLPSSTTADIQVIAIPGIVFTTPETFADLSITAGNTSADIVSISGGTLAADNLELQYDGTGLTGGSFPATQKQASSITSGAGGISTVAAGAVVTIGDENGTSYTDTFELDSVYHEITPIAGDIDLYYQFDTGSNGVATSVIWDGIPRANNDTMNVFQWNWTASAWEQIDIIEGENNSNDDSYAFKMSNAATGAGVDEGLVRVRFQSDNIINFDTDRIWVEYTSVAESGFIIHSGIAQAGGNNTITLDVTAAAQDDSYVNSRVITVFGTGSEQENIITDYNGTTKVATVKNAWIVNPDATTGFNVTAGQVHTSTQSGGYDNNTVYIDLVNGATGTQIGVNGTIDNPLSSLPNARTVADDSRVNSNRFEFVRSTSGVTLDQDYTSWLFRGRNPAIMDLGGFDVSLSSFVEVVVGGICTNNTAVAVYITCGIIDLDCGNSNFIDCGLVTELKMSESGAAYTSQGMFNNRTDALPAAVPTITFNGDGISAIRFEGSNHSGSYVIKGMTSVDILELYGDCRITLDSTCNGGTFIHGGDVKIIDNSTTSPTFTDGVIKDTNDKVSLLPNTTVFEARTLLSAEYSTAANLATVDGNVDAILVDTGTYIPAQITALNDISVAQIFSGGDADGYTLEEALKLLLSASAGVLAGAATNSITIEAVDGSKTRLTATVDVDGNRSVVVKDATG